ncbi:PQQ-binding-like beta-propeller repeat protein [Brucepastera parasyntrophica]|uniref:outer membrane protein assembly factor BamB family protein n=1 Tax=Brucepastera parasyntrophica TaxID=2880008 RepID=UPI00210E73BB|nr:PQQ-binding-like beta-propeller repeat protein [Brucepastera parasyntrophica]ULQ60033.1 PQQ-binding-like beta-propeller repeat protein [Brucepastera parasyntrophica]
MKNKCVWLSVIYILCIHSTYAIEAAWTRVLTGDVICSPAVRNGRIYVTTSDRTLTCLSESGGFLWTRSFRSKMLPYTYATRYGNIYTASENGLFMVFNADGSVLWQRTEAEIPAYPPLEGRDGRFFLFGSASVQCITTTGRNLWTVNLNEKIVFPPGETGDGDILVPCQNGLLIRVSPFGEIREHITLHETPAVFIPIRGGFVAGFPSGSIRAYDIRHNRGDEAAPTEEIWRFSGGSPVSVFMSEGGTLAALHQNGVLQTFNITDGTTLWEGKTGIPVQGKVSVSEGYGQFTFAYKGYAGAWNVSGRKVWEHILPEHTLFPVLSQNGNVFAAAPGWMLYGFRAETRITGTPPARDQEFYGIMKGRVMPSGYSAGASITYIRQFLASVTQELDKGSIGMHEIFYAHRLAEILENKSIETRNLRSFAVPERARAAILLGQMGSMEYRQILIDCMSTETEPTIITGLLYALAAIGCDPDGKTLAAISTVIQKNDLDDLQIHFAVCDALYSVGRYSSGQIQIESVQMLSSFLKKPYHSSIQNYARQKLKNILQ